MAVMSAEDKRPQKVWEEVIPARRHGGWGPGSQTRRPRAGDRRAACAHAATGYIIIRISRACWQEEAASLASSPRTTACAAPGGGVS